MADLGRIATNNIIPGSGTSKKQGFINDDLDIKNIYSILNKLRGMYVGTIAPASPNVGDLWRDTSTTPSVVKEWTGSAWAAVDFILRVNESGKLPVSITGDAATVGGKSPGTGPGNIPVLNENAEVPIENLPPISSGVPIGSVLPWTTTTIPDGWLECNGQAVSRTGFSELFAKIGTTFGAGDGSTTFNVPDLRGEFIRGLDRGRGVDSGRVLGSWQAQQITAHKHIFTWGESNYTASQFGRTNNAGKYGVGNSVDYDNYWWYTNDGTDFDGAVNPTGLIGPETRPRNVALMFIIKAKEVAGSDPVVEGSNADTVDGYHASAFALTGHIHTDASTIKPALNASGDAPVYACRAWVNFDGTTSPPTIRASGNVSSVVKTSNGLFTVNFTNPAPNANYCTTISFNAGYVSNHLFVEIGNPTYSTTGFNFRIQDGSAATFYNLSQLCAAVFY